MGQQAKRSVTRGVAALAVVIAFGAVGVRGVGEEREPSYTYHQALTGDFAASIDLGDTPIKSDVIMFYEHTLGKLPRINPDTGRYINGGLPQYGNYSAHSAHCLQDIVRAIPDPDWDGYAVIDYESWTPWWEDTPRRYRDATIAELRRHNTSLGESELEELGSLLYEHHARIFFEGTLQLGKVLRPKAKWGYWSYPKARHRDHLEETSWLYELSDVLYPSVYMKYFLIPDSEEPEIGEAHYSTYFHDVLDGRVAFARELAGDEKPVLAFAWPRYGQTNPNQWLRYRELEPEHLQLMLCGPYFWDADGIVLWDNIPQQGLATVFQEYYDQDIAPTIGMMHDFVLEQDRLHEEQRAREDTNDDGVVDTADLSYVISKMGTDDELADINQDGIVDTVDLILVQLAFTNHAG